jgi:hypothetical protein
MVKKLHLILCTFKSDEINISLIERLQKYNLQWQTAIVKPLQSYEYNERIAKNYTKLTFKVMIFIQVL